MRLSGCVDAGIELVTEELGSYGMFLAAEHFVSLFRLVYGILLDSTKLLRSFHLFLSLL